MKTIIYCIIVVFTALLLNIQVYGADVESIQSGDWFSEDTWEGNNIPNPSDNVLIKHAVTVTRQGPFISEAKANNVTINSLGSLTLYNMTWLTVQGNFSCSGNFLMSNNTFAYFYGNITNIGYWDATSNSSAVLLYGTSNQTFSNSGTISNYIYSLYIYNNAGVTLSGTEKIPVNIITLVTGQLSNSGNLLLVDNASIQRGYDLNLPAGYFDSSPDFNYVTRYNLIYHKSSSQITTGVEYNSSKSLNSLTINNNNLNGVKLSNNFNIADYGRVTMTRGKIDLNGYALSYGYCGTLEYNMTAIQTTADAEFPIDNGPSNLVINNSYGVILHSDRIIKDSLYLNIGTFDNDGKDNNLLFFLQNEATIVRSGGRLSAAPQFETSVNVVYNQYSAPITTEYEIPSDPAILNNVKINNSNGIKLGSDFNINGTLTMVQGSIETNTYILSYGENGSLLYKGIAAQTIGKSEFPEENGPKNLEINNIYGVTMTASRSITGEIKLTQGALNTNIYIITLGDNTTTGSISRTNGLIVGTFKRYVQNSRSSTYDFFIGPNLSHALTVNLVFSGGLIDGGTVTARWIDNITHNGPGSLTDNGKVIDRVANGCWEITSDLPNPITSINVNVDNYIGVIDPVNYTQLRVLRRTDSGAPWQLLGDHVNAVQSGSYYTVKRINLNAFSQFVVAGSSSDGNFLQGPLPVKLTSLSAAVNGMNVQLKWTTTEEYNNSGFDVERKSDNTEGWTKVGFVSGHGNKNTPTSYKFDDRNLMTGKYNYRIKQIDYNGNYEYFALEGNVEIGVPSKYDLSQNYPNPFNPATNINFEIPSPGLVSIKVYDLSGREVSTIINEYKTAGFYTVNYNASGLSSGTYFYRLFVNGNTFTKKMTLIK